MKRVATDDRRTDIILPERVVYATEGVLCQDWILECGDMQTQPATKKYTELSTYGGKKAAIRTVFGNDKIVEESLLDIAKNNPLPCWPNEITNYSVWYLRIIYDWYRYSGNTAFVEGLAYYWKPLLEQLLPLVHEKGEQKLVEDELATGYFIDWPSKNHREAEAGNYALWAQGLYDAAKLCEIIGDDALAKVCVCKAKALQNTHFEPGAMKQITAMLQLAGMADKEKVSNVLTAGGGRGMSTFMSCYILKAVGQTADMRVALDMLREYYGGMLAVGATTFWEDFDLDWLREGASIEQLWGDGEYDIHGDNGRYCYEGFRHSLCHGWSSGPTAFLSEEVLGCHIIEDGCKTLAIKPNLGDLEWAEGVYPTPYGDVFISVKKQDGEMKVHVKAPDNVTIICE